MLGLFFVCLGFLLLLYCGKLENLLVLLVCVLSLGIFIKVFLFVLVVYNFVVNGLFGECEWNFWCLFFL